MLVLLLSHSLLNNVVTAWGSGSLVYITEYAKARSHKTLSTALSIVLCTYFTLLFDLHKRFKEGMSMKQDTQM
jgi:hypothetical protein